MILIIYVDVLIFSNIVIDYILLLLTAVVTNKNYKNYRIIIASVIAGFSSLYIFLEINSSIVNIIAKIIFSALFLLIDFGFKSIKSYVIECYIFLALSFSLCGLIDFLQNISSDFAYTNNLVNYVNISPITLVLLTIFFYIIIKLIYKFIDRKSFVNKVDLVITLLSNEFKLVALVDSGHTLTDPISLAQIVVLDSDIFEKMVCTGEDLKNRTRVIPTKTISGSALLEGIRCDLLKIYVKDNVIEHKNPIVIKTKEKFGYEYKAIISKSAIY